MRKWFPVMMMLALSGCGNEDEPAAKALKQMQQAADMMNEAVIQNGPKSFPSEYHAFNKWAAEAVLPSSQDADGLKFDATFNPNTGTFHVSVSGLSDESCAAMTDQMPKTGPRKANKAWLIGGFDRCDAMPRALDMMRGRSSSPSFGITFCLPAVGVQCPEPGKQAVTRMRVS